MRTTLRTTVLGAALALAAGACAPFIRTPATFAEMDRPGYGYKYKAIAPDEVTIAAKKRPNEPKGDVQFWTKVLTEKIPLTLGYVLAGEKDVTTDSGVAGKLLTFTIEREDGNYTYLVGVFVKKKKMWLFEAGGRQDAFAKHEAEIVAAARTMGI